jgi:hypothetical protein
MTLAGWTPDTGILRVSNGPGVRVDAMYVSPNYFPLLDVPLARGPGFTQREPADEPEVIVAHRLWRNRLDADPGIVGRTIVVNGTSHVVVGVLPERFRGHLAQHRPGFELFLPLARHPRLAGPDTRRVNRTIDWVQVLGRLSPGRTRAGANAVVASIMAGLAQRYPGDERAEVRVGGAVLRDGRAAAHRYGRRRLVRAWRRLSGAARCVSEHVRHGAGSQCVARA